MILRKLLAIQALHDNMGRTIQTPRIAVDMTERKFKYFRRALRPIDRDRLDKIFEYARQYGDTGTMVNVPNKVDVVLISSMLELIGRIEDLEAVTDKIWKNVN